MVVNQKSLVIATILAAAVGGNAWASSFLSPATALSASGFTPPLSGTTYNYITLSGITSDGRLIGGVSQFLGAGASSGEIYIWDPASGANPTPVIETGSGFLRGTSPSNYYATAYSANSSNGTILGAAYSSPVGTAYNTTPVVYSGGTISVIGLPTLGDVNGSNYLSPSGYFNGNVVGSTFGVNNSGNSVGQFTRWPSSPAIPAGSDAYYYSNGPSPLSTAPATYIIGLTASAFGNTYVGTYNGTSWRVGTASAINSSNVAVGTQERILGYDNSTIPNPLASTAPGFGNDGYLYNGNTNTNVQIGLVSATPTAYTNGGYSAPDYDGTASNNILGIVQNTGKLGVNDKGLVLGTSSVLSNFTTTSTSGTFFHLSSGGSTEAWVYKPSATPGTAYGYGTSAAGTYKQIGLTAPIPTPTDSNPTVGNVSIAGLHISVPIGLNNANNAAGTSNRYISQTVAGVSKTAGTDSWFYNGATGSTIRIAPLPNDAVNGIDYTASATAALPLTSVSTVTAINSTTMVGGTLTRYLAGGSTSIGTDAWVYDAAASHGAGAIFPIMPFSSSLYADATIAKISDSGVAIGYYKTFNDNFVTDLSSITVFAWSKIFGLQTLESIAYTGSNGSNTNNSGMDSSLLSVIKGFQVRPDGTIYGANIPNIASTGSITPAVTSILAFGLPTLNSSATIFTPAGNWSTVAPNFTDGTGVALLGSTSTAPQTITVDAPVRLGQLTFNSGASAVTLIGYNVITLQGIQGYAGLTVANGNHTINAPVVLDYSTDITVANATDSITLSNVSASAGSTVTKYGAGTATLNSFPSGGAILWAGTLALSSAGTNHTLLTFPSGFFTFNGGKLDLNNNDAIISGDAALAVTASTSIAAPKIALVGGHNVLVTTAVISGSDWLTLHPGQQFDGQTVTGSELLLRYAYAGDATLDGTINLDDYLQIDQGYKENLTGYIHGDFNHDGTINAADYALIDYNFSQQSGTLAVGEIALHTAEFGASYVGALQALTAVPEPASLLIVSTGAAMLLRRRR